MIRRFFGSTIKVGNNPNHFVSIWKTDNPGDSATNQIQLPITLGANPNLEVDWGDGNIDLNTTLHTYAVAGTYPITIKSHGYSDFRCGYQGDRRKIIEVKQWGGIYFASGSHYSLAGSSNMISTATDLPNVTHKSQFLGFLAGCNKFNQPIENLNVSNGINFEKFLEASSGFNQPLGLLPIENGTNFKAFLEFVKISNSTYDQTLVGWASKVLKPNIVIHMGTAKYSSVGETAKNSIIANYNWSFTDGGLQL